IRLRTFLPKTNTLLLHKIEKGRFIMLSAHEVLGETRRIIESLEVTSEIFSDHYTNYVNVYGRMPDDKGRIIRAIDNALNRDESYFRPIYVGTQ
ncbi:MAG: radical SAM protein, partial [Desulfobacteraceae bacterium]